RKCPGAAWRGGRADRRIARRRCVVIPAGVAHKRESASADLLVIGSYPRSQSPDIRRAEARAHGDAVGHIAAVPLPDADPVTGRAEPLLACWADANRLACYPPRSGAV